MKFVYAIRNIFRVHSRLNSLEQHQEAVMAQIQDFDTKFDELGQEVARIAKLVEDQKGGLTESEAASVLTNLDDLKARLQTIQ